MQKKLEGEAHQMNCSKRVFLVKEVLDSSAADISDASKKSSGKMPKPSGNKLPVRVTAR